MEMNLTHLALESHNSYRLPMGPLLAESISSKSVRRLGFRVNHIHLHCAMQTDVENTKSAFETVARIETTVLGVTLSHSQICLPLFILRSMIIASSEIKLPIMDSPSRIHVPVVVNIVLSKVSCNGS